MTDNRTTELRDKLDALNIEHFDYDKGGRTQTQWEAPDGKRHFTYETSNNSAKTARLVIAWHPTPEQAIAATLGNERGTCHAESDLSEWVCSNCQCWIPLGLTPENIKHASEWRYCPHCGAKVVNHD